MAAPVGDFGLSQLYLRYVHRRPRTFHVRMIRFFAAAELIVSLIPWNGGPNGRMRVIELAGTGDVSATAFAVFFTMLVLSQVLLWRSTPDADVFAAFAHGLAVAAGIAGFLTDHRVQMNGPVIDSPFLSMAMLTAFLLPVVSGLFYVSLFQVTWPDGVEHTGWLRRIAEFGNSRRALREFAAKHQFALQTGSGQREPTAAGTYRWHPASLEGTWIGAAGTYDRARCTVFRMTFESLKLPLADVKKAPKSSDRLIIRVMDALPEPGTGTTEVQVDHGGQTGKIAAAYAREPRAFDLLLDGNDRALLEMGGARLSYRYPHKFWRGFDLSVRDVEATLDALLRVGTALEGSFPG